MQSLPETGSSSDKNFNLSVDEYTSENENKHFSADKIWKKDFSSESENEKDFW